MYGIVRIATGRYGTNSYIIYTDGVGMVVDVGENAEELIDTINRLGLGVEAILITHGHADHFAGLPMLRKALPQAKIGMNRRDLEVAEFIAPMMYPKRYRELLESLEIEIDLAEGIYRFGEIVFRVLETPGHSPGSIAIYLSYSNTLFTGDTLFAGAVGRTDLFGGSEKELAKSICRFYRELPSSTHVYPGHGPETTLENEYHSNFYIRHILERCRATT